MLKVNVYKDDVRIYNSDKIKDWAPSRANFLLLDSILQELEEDEEETDSYYKIFDYGIAGAFDGEEIQAIEVNGYRIKSSERFGGEGQGDTYWLVLEVAKDDKITYWQINGWYNSYDGGELELSSIFQVKKAQKVVDVWVAV